MMDFYPALMPTFVFQLRIIFLTIDANEDSCKRVRINIIHTSASSSSSLARSAVIYGTFTSLQINIPLVKTSLCLLKSTYKFFCIVYMYAMKWRDIDISLASGK